MLEFLDTLESAGVIEGASKARIAAAVDATSEPWDQVICRLGLVTEERLARALSEYSGVPICHDPVAGIVPASLNDRFLSTRRALPLNMSKLDFGIVDPLDEKTQAGIRFVVPDARFHLVTQTQFAGQSQSLSQTAPERAQSNAKLDTDQLNDLASSEPVVRHVDRLIGEAQRRRASDLHLEPTEQGVTVRHRRDGVLETIETLSSSEGLAVCSRIKILARLDIAERHRPQDGRLTYPVAGQRIDLRVSSVPTSFGESLVVRLLDQSAVTLDYVKLGFLDHQISRIRNWLTRPEGLILVTGPTGSGKTTSLYTFLDDIADGRRKILTIEDPIEYRLSNVTQSQVDPARDVTFANALRAFLRHDPDVMLVGEIRDQETAKTSIEAAQTGHLVLSTLHTNDAAAAVTRLVDLGIAPYLIASTLVGVMGQRLVGKICERCGGPGCAACDQTGRSGRVAILELLEISEKTRAAIRNREPERNFRETDPSFVPMRQDGAEKISTRGAIAGDVARIVGQISEDS